MSQPSRLHDLIELAGEPSSERRRELLRGVTDMFIALPPAELGAAEMGLFDDLMVRLTSEMEEEVRVELSHKIAPRRVAPMELLRSLAGDDIRVAEPVLSQSTALSDPDLVNLVRTRGQEHMRVISSRAEVSAEVSAAILEHGDDDTVGVLLRNAGARMSRTATEAAVDRAHANPDLHAAVVERRGLPADLLNEMYFIVEARLRETIMARHAELDPEAIEEALEAGRARMSARDGLAPADLPKAEAEIRAMVKKGELTPTMLTRMLRAGDKTKFVAALAELSEIDFFTARRILEGRQVDPLAIVCKAAGFDRILFLTFVVLMLDRESDPIGRAQAYGDLYSEMTREMALRAIRFWRMRRQSTPLAAA